MWRWLLWFTSGPLDGGETTRAVPGLQGQCSIALGETDVGCLVVQSLNHRSIGSWTTPSPAPVLPWIPCSTPEIWLTLKGSIHFKMV